MTNPDHCFIDFLTRVISIKWLMPEYQALTEVMPAKSNV